MHIVPCEIQRLQSFTVAHIRTFLHVALRASCMFILQNNKSFISSKLHTLLLVNIKLFEINAFKFSYNFSIIRKYVRIMDDEVYIRPFVTFDHDPIITILATLRSVSFVERHLSFDLKTSYNNIISTYTCDICTNYPSIIPTFLC